MDPLSSLSSPQVQAAFVSGVMTILLLFLGKYIDTRTKKRAITELAQRVSLSPQAQKSWEGAYLELTDKYLTLEDEVAGIRRDLDSLASSVRAEPWDVAQRIFGRAKSINATLKVQPEER